MAPHDAGRRSFLKTMAAGAAGTTLSGGMTARSYARIAGANDRVSVGIIGMGRMARGHLNNLLGFEDVQVTAICDVYEPNLAYGLRRADGADGFRDFRALLDREDVDAVVVGSPDHWHALHTVLACQAGKDVYVEKPISLTVAEGRKMVEAAHRYDRVVQVGTQQRSNPIFRQAVEIIHRGDLGEISFVRTWNVSNAYPDGIGSPPDSAPPPDLDWDLWLGPAPRVAFNPNRFGVQLNEQGDYTRWATFRWFWDYAGGMMTDWGVHLLDIVHWAMQVDYPESVSASGGKLLLRDNRETPDTLVATFRYPSFVCTYENRVCNGFPLEGRGYGILFHGTRGTLFVNRQELEVVPEAGSDLQPLASREGRGGHAAHMRDFIDAVKARTQPVCDIETGHRSSSVAMLGNIAYRSGRRIDWDGQRERILGDDYAASLLWKPYRGAWSLDG